MAPGSIDLEENRRPTPKETGRVRGAEIASEVLFLDTNTRQVEVTTDAIAGHQKGYANTMAQEQA